MKKLTKPSSNMLEETPSMALFLGSMIPLFSTWLSINFFLISDAKITAMLGWLDIYGIKNFYKLSARKLPTLGSVSVNNKKITLLVELMNEFRQVLFCSSMYFRMVSAETCPAVPT
ncbi:MAG: hypothetical protein H5T33_03560 [Candidatus Methanosuratus sp.]|nr:hypothetical protein [Candidatus Methanosuratincola sp.]